MERGGQYLSREDMAAIESADEIVPDDQLVADAADDVSAGKAPGEVATLDPGDAPAVEDEVLEDAYEDLPGSGTASLPIGYYFTFAPIVARLLPAP